MLVSKDVLDQNTAVSRFLRMGTYYSRLLLSVKTVLNDIVQIRPLSERPQNLHDGYAMELKRFCLAQHNVFKTSAKRRRNRNGKFTRRAREEHLDVVEVERCELLDAWSCALEPSTGAIFALSSQDLCCAALLYNCI